MRGGIDERLLIVALAIGEHGGQIGKKLAVYLRYNAKLIRSYLLKEGLAVNIGYTE